jgi:heme exporter protein A
MLRLSGQDLSCIRGFRTVFQGVNFELAGGEALALTGRNGSGKSSLLRLIAGLLYPATGTVALEGSKLEGTKEDASVAEQAHYLGHLDAFKPALTVTENLSFWSRYLGPGRPTAAALAAVGLEGLAQLPAGYLSAGQRRRLSLARLLATGRPLWLLDEPTSALDSAGQEMLTTLMRDHLAGGGMIVAATHGPLGIECTELRLGQWSPSPPAGAGRSEPGAPSDQPITTPTPSPSPQGGGEPASVRGRSSA